MLADSDAVAILDRCWHVFGAQRLVLREVARSTFGGSEEKAKKHFAHIGLFLARRELASQINRETVGRHFALARAIYHARKSLSEERPYPPEWVSLLLVENRGVPDAKLIELLGLAERRTSPSISSTRVDEMQELMHAATAPQERQLIRAFREKDCRTLGEVERLCGWNRGHASVVFGRLRAKVIRRLVA